VGTVLDATTASIEAARAANQLLPQDEGAVAALLVLAEKIDGLADQKAGVTEDGELVEERKRPQQLDNVTVPTFLKYCDALGLTPAGRKALAEKKRGATGGKLGQLRLANQGEAAAS